MSVRWRRYSSAKASRSPAAMRAISRSSESGVSPTSLFSREAGKVPGRHSQGWNFRASIFALTLKLLGPFEPRGGRSAFLGGNLVFADVFGGELVGDLDLDRAQVVAAALLRPAGRHDGLHRR